MLPMIKKRKVLQFICPTGFYGAERWVLALAKHLDPDTTICDLAVTMEPGQKPLELVKEYQKLNLANRKAAIAMDDELVSIMK